MQYRNLWVTLGLVLVISFAVLGYYGIELYNQAPPIPESVVLEDGTVIFTKEDIQDGQNVWQSIGGQQLGSIWGHGAYVAPDWSTDWLHRECVWLVEKWSATDYGKSYGELNISDQAVLKSRLKQEIRTNTFDKNSRTLLVSSDRAEAIQAMSSYYDSIFGDAKSFSENIKALSDGKMNPVELREAYAIPANTIKDPERQRKMNAFFFWTAWVCSTERPTEFVGVPGIGDFSANDPITYTNNWPAESLIDNRPTSSILVWSILSFVLLLAGIGALAWYYAVLKKNEEEESEVPGIDPFLDLKPTPSMNAALNYFWVVIGLMITQIVLGAITAHYGVEGDGFYGFPLAEWLPYSVTRTWHSQLGIFWIATAWLATGLFMAPAVSGHEPKFQRAGVYFLLVSLVTIVVGSLFGTWYATRQSMGLETNFWFGHQGYEYVELGRFWQIYLFIGLNLWVILMVRALWPAFRRPGEDKHLLALFLLSSAAIALFYGSGLMWGQHTNLAIAEYWRWWVVHLWVEGFFEVFATVVIAFLFTRMKLLNVVTATKAVLFATSIFLAGGIIGTFHHLYFTGTPTVILALGSVFSAMEVVPLVLIGFEAYENLTLTRAQPWVTKYKWPIYFFIAVAFWNLVGAGLFGFLINPPIALYYLQGLNTTPVHAHTALFGVYGMLGIGLMLFCLKASSANQHWKTGTLSFAFWSINAGLVTMILLSLLPIGLLQAWASVEHGMWYARSAEFLQTDLMENLRWLRAIGDTFFAVGIVSLAWFTLGTVTGWSLEKELKYRSEK